jgi:hypothetical protein
VGDAGVAPTKALNLTLGTRVLRFPVPRCCHPKLKDYAPIV